MYADEVEIISYSYPDLTLDVLNKFHREYDREVLGQHSAERRILESLYQYHHSPNHSKPLVLMFYGPSGVGKTETAKFLSRLLDGKLMRQQLSMFQNQTAYDYLFGSSTSQRSFARDISNRESNVVLLDEFDKVNPLLYSAFYQIFDEGIYCDTNYEVKTENMIIICTSNFESELEIRRIMGNAMYYRFDSFIRFNKLSQEAMQKVASGVLNVIWSQLTKAEKHTVGRKRDLKEVFVENIKLYKNYRHAERLMNQYVYSRLVSKRIFHEK
ncbi:AAA family ATPase [Sporolactobacillus spathodeae]|uniref:ATP-dependent Clp protease ATP-binding subunit ClpA n=1 Tax=Sporolactobacillus spathodeae TaxID=1465502 RepID=A0ABS2Q9E7_9BACL|nr:AAA family ATPase [Sporolactobacillus spathodeae]MBM7658413.1 ATP-dependent Clp protease ATP-binding subunit ClpA [Sporolactobacillus spathodeae]